MNENKIWMGTLKQNVGRTTNELGVMTFKNIVFESKKVFKDCIIQKMWLSTQISLNALN